MISVKARQFQRPSTVLVELDDTSAYQGDCTNGGVGLTAHLYV
jgi:hypothetical protein